MARPLSSISALAALALAFELGLAGCGEPAAPASSLLSLTRGFRPSTSASLEGTTWLPAMGSERALELFGEPDSAGFWIRSKVARRDWRGSSKRGILRWRYPFAPEGQPPGGREPFVLYTDERTFDSVPFGVDAGELHDPKPGTVSCLRRSLYLVLGEGEVPPDEATFETWIDRGREQNGEWRLSLGAYTAPGIPVWSGHAEDVTVDLPPNSALRFATICTASLEDFYDQSKRLTFTVELDGEPIFLYEQLVNDLIQAESHTLKLPPEGREGARLTFRVDGPAALAAYLSPIVGPAEVPAFDDPERDPRPNVVLFVADTFRADNMAAYGNELELTPNLDRLAEESRVFTRSWSVSSWTLPAQTTLISGLFPHQHGVVERTRRLTEDAVTVAERFAEAGYRTGAVTGGGYLSPAFAFDQGFSWFDQSWTRWDVEDTTDDVEDFLDTDDGRPVFLFVQTYRAHGPFIAKPETAERFRGTLRLDRTWRQLAPVVDEVQELQKQGGEMTDEHRARVAELGELYRGAVHDLDRGFGAFRAMLERRGLWDTTYLLFTSDHGEAFAEHEHLLHGKGVYDETARVPMLLFGPDVEPALVDHAVTLVDAARTLAEAAGIAPDARWRGESLLSLDRDRPAFVFDCALDRPDFEAAVVRGDRKIVFDDTRPVLDPGAIRGVYDLTADPAERRNLLEEEGLTDAEREWLASELGIVRAAELAPAGAVLDDDARAAMDALGYTGDD